MGCAVNGPGEAKQTDLGIAFGNNAGHLYYKGENLGKVKESDAMDSLKELIRRYKEEQI